MHFYLLVVMLVSVMIYVTNGNPIRLDIRDTGLELPTIMFDIDHEKNVELEERRVRFDGDWSLLTVGIPLGHILSPTLPPPDALQEDNSK